MPAAIPTAIRELIITWHEEDDLGAQDIADRARISKSTVYKVLDLYYRFGQVTNPNVQHCGVKRLLNADDLAYLFALLEAKPSIFLDELRYHLAAFREVDVSLATLSRTLTRLCVTHKKVSKQAYERSEELRALYTARVANSQHYSSFS
jgi:transposase